MDTLVLSHAWEPVSRIPWQRAITLLWEEKVEVIEEYEDRYVRSVTLEFKVPSIIRFLRKIRDRKRAIKFSRHNIHVRDHGKCQYCGAKTSLSDFTYDHVIPRAQGGKTDWTNVVVCCTPCNQRKGGRTPEQARMKLLAEPIKPKSLPDTIRLTLTLTKDIPESWRNFIASYHHWNDELV